MKSTKKGGPIATVTRADPPAPVHGKYDWAKIALALKSAPMVWHKVFEKDTHSRVVSVRQGSVNAVNPAAGFEFTTSNNTWEQIDGKNVRVCSLYARYNPDKDTTKDRSNT